MSNNNELFTRAQVWMPGGVNSPARAFKSVGGIPPFIKRGSGAFIWDEDDAKYIDFVLSWGPLIHGHNNSVVREAVAHVLDKGTSFGAPTEIEVSLAELIVNAVPSIEKVRMVNSGTEATMSALRLARGFTGKDKIIKFAGCYHGHADSFLIQAGSGGLTLSEPNSPGVTKNTSQDTLLAEYNSIESVKRLVDIHQGSIAAVIIEPIAGNMGCVPPSPGFLKELREVTENENILLIFDEVMTGFRVAFGGAQELYGVTPDITTLGKIIGGGFPVGAYGARKDIMDMVAPDGPVYQAGTLSGNPVSMTAGFYSLKLIQDDPHFYVTLEEKASAVEAGVRHNLKRLGLDYYYSRVGSMSTLFFTSEKVVSLPQVTRSDTKLFARYFHALLSQGVYVPCSQYEALFLSAVHTADDIDCFIDAQYNALKKVLN